jgi:predicted transcriptional regulator
MRATLERTVLKVLWSTERQLSVREVLEQVNATRSEPLAYTTVMTVLSRLTAKGSVVRHDERKPHSYRAAAEDETALAVRKLLAEHGEAAVPHFLAQAAADPAVHARLLDMIGASVPTLARGPGSNDLHAARPPSWTEFYRGPLASHEAPPSEGTPTDDWTRWIAG